MTEGEVTVMQGGAAMTQGGAAMTQARTHTLQVRYFAGASAAAGTGSEELELAVGADAGALRAELVRRHPGLGPVLQVATLLVDGVASRDPAATLDDATQVDVLPPFAGG